MIRGRLEAVMSSRRVVPVSVLITLALGLVFIFVRAPHPWGWYGIDQYHPLAIDLAEGRPFATTDVPWGYPYFLAVFYRLFGPVPWPALVAQAVLNAAVPILVYQFAAATFSTRVAAVAALLTGLLSFNTIYASTESTDSVCTVLFMAAIVLVDRARRADRGWAQMAAAGALLGIAAQFRPNLIVTPAVIAAVIVLVDRGRRAARLRQAALMLVVTLAMIAPWTFRNYRLTGLFIPSSTHGAVQLWYGSLQSGPWLTSAAFNPRRAFEAPAFDYSSLTHAPVEIRTAARDCAAARPESVTLIWWEAGGGAPSRTAMAAGADGSFAAAIPATGAPRTLYYHFEAAWPSSAAATATPPDGRARPFVFYVTGDHLGDLDAARDWHDVFDVIRLMRHLAWDEPVTGTAADRNGDGRLDRDDLNGLVAFLLGEPAAAGGSPFSTFDADGTRARVTLRDGSQFAVPRDWRGRVTDVALTPGRAGRLTHARYLVELPSPATTYDPCRLVDRVDVNGAFYLQEPHRMRRYSALAWDNIRRAPLDYLIGVAYRSIRLFVVRGSDDSQTAHQFSGSGRVYGVASALSAALFALGAIGAVIGWRRGHDIWLPLALIAHIPATIAFVLINMRYTITVQPLIFMFVAVAVTAWSERPQPARSPR